MGKRSSAGDDGVIASTLERRRFSEDSLRGASSDPENSVYGSAPFDGSVRGASVLDRIRAGDCRMPGFEAKKPWEKEEAPGSVDSLNRCVSAWPFRMRGDVRYHMRSFHLQWLGMFVAFIGWFSIPPLLPVIASGLELGHTELVVSNAIAVSGPILSRVVVGVVSDRYGPRLAQSLVLAAGSLTVGLAACSTSAAGLTAARFFISFLGGALVPCQHHVSILFAPAVVGSALGIAAGWGNLGGGVAQLVMPALYEAIVASGVAPDRAWRAALALPAALAAALSALLWFLARDLPAGSWSAMRARGLLPRASPLAAFGVAARDYRSWLLAVSYGASFGVELIAYNFAVVFYVDRFGLSLGSASLAAALFGCMNLISRPLGGILSDLLARRWGVRARIQLLFFALLGEGLLLLLFSRMESLPASLFALAAFAVCAQAGAGATFALVPLLTRRALGSASGIVAAGGNFGAFFGGLLFLLVPADEPALTPPTLPPSSSSHIPRVQWENAFLLLGALVTISAPLCIALRFNGISMLSKRAGGRGGGAGGYEPRAGRSTRNGTAFQSVVLPPESGSYLIREVVRALNAASEHPIELKEYVTAVGSPKRTGTEFLVKARVSYGAAQGATLEALFFQHFDFETFDLLAARVRLCPAIPGGRRRYCLANLERDGGGGLGPSPTATTSSSSSRSRGERPPPESADVFALGDGQACLSFPRAFRQPVTPSERDPDEPAESEDSINSRKGLLLQARRAAMGPRSTQSTLAAALADPSSALSRCLASGSGAALLHTPRERAATPATPTATEADPGAEATDSEDSINSRKGLMLQARRAAMMASRSSQPQPALAAALVDPSSASGAGGALPRTPRGRPADGAGVAGVRLSADLSQLEAGLAGLGEIEIGTPGSPEDPAGPAPAPAPGPGGREGAALGIGSVQLAEVELGELEVPRALP
eukprot:tig00021108_g18298.t1